MAVGAARRGRKTAFRGLGGTGVLVLLGLLVALEFYGPAPSTPPPADMSTAVERAYAERRSDLVVEVRGVVERSLPDDREGSRHQRFILRLDSGHTVLVSHNIDLAPRVEGVRAGEVVGVRGEYEWNERGGVIHWTHRDPDGRRAGGWVEHEGRRYR